MSRSVILKSFILVLSPHYRDGATDGVLQRIAITYVYDLLR